MEKSIHTAVMTTEALQALKPQSGGTYIDATLGGGTHTAALLDASAPEGRVLSIDVDPAALNRARDRFASLGDRWKCAEGNFREIERIATQNDFRDVDGILIDLGVSSDELLDSSKGLSFQVAGPLDMRLGPTANTDGLTAAQIVNTWSAAEIEEILREYGEERYARRIAAHLVKSRSMRRFETTLDLAEAVRAAVPQSYERGRIHPATRTFQALRIAVNDELNALNEAIASAVNLLKTDGVLAIISFHSLEDRIVKQAFKTHELLTPLTKRPLIPTEQEINQNPRARSAKFRAARKINHATNQNTNKQIWDSPTPSL